MSSPILARRLEAVWYGQSSLARILQPLAWLFGIGVRLRRTCYRRGWLASSHPGVPVVVIGNLTVGGVGKTPLVGWLASRLREAGWHPAIISRGYGGSRTREPVHVSPASDTRAVGDEAVLLARQTGLPVVVAVDRLRAARAAAESGADVIVADDGLQHYALARDVEIVVIDAARGLGNGRLLPAGPLREPASRLESTDLVVFNGGHPPGGGVCFSLANGDPVSLTTGARCALSDFAGYEVWAVAGIGNPERFYAGLRNAGMSPVAVDVPDHGRTDLSALRCQNDWPILMTEKDAVKYPDCADPAVWYVPAMIQIAPDSAAAIIERILPALAAGGVSSLEMVRNARA